MPKGPRGQKRHADAITCGIRTARIACGRDTEDPAPDPNRVWRSKLGALRRSEAMTAAQRSAAAKHAQRARMAKKNDS